MMMASCNACKEPSKAARVVIARGANRGLRVLVRCGVRETVESAQLYALETQGALCGPMPANYTLYKFI